mmetsp:Transcript_48724/g.152938  ORF Transcript_48724/g.152938 Transcript_48724/m.152938 type:complete len:99 (-) Transcript_48724:2027-2323(-)
MDLAGVGGTVGEIVEEETAEEEIVVVEEAARGGQMTHGITERDNMVVALGVMYVLSYLVLQRLFELVAFPREEAERVVGEWSSAHVQGLCYVSWSNAC